jgi:hypothetical protein
MHVYSTPFRRRWLCRPGERITDLLSRSEIAEQKIAKLKAGQLKGTS